VVTTAEKEEGPVADLRLRSVENLISRVLFVGGVISIGIVLVGIVLYAVGGGARAQVAGLPQLREGRPAGVYVSVPDILRGLTRRPRDPLALVALGLALLMATPLIGVAVAVLAFLSIRDYDYVVISGIVLVILVASLFLGGAG
jgi:uncharacterized membrane protein